jgi:hypothetical protein
MGDLALNGRRELEEVLITWWMAVMNEYRQKGGSRGSRGMHLISEI